MKHTSSITNYLDMETKELFNIYSDDKSNKEVRDILIERNPLSTRLSEEGIGEETIAEIERRFDARGARYGEARNVDGAMARRILEACR